MQRRIGTIAVAQEEYGIDFSAASAEPTQVMTGCAACGVGASELTTMNVTKVWGWQRSREAAVTISKAISQTLLDGKVVTK
jgi:hypothetical protein